MYCEIHEHENGCISIEIEWGDWKHDHAYSDHLMREMGYDVKSLRFYSSDDNKVYPVPLPEDDVEMFEKFKRTNREMQSFSMDNFVPENELKCQTCIYNDFCDRPLAPKLYNGGF